MPADAARSKPPRVRRPAGAQRGRGGLGEETYQRLKAAIISGELPPDAPLSEVGLAERLNISRTPVREALARLVNENMVRNIPGRGSRVAELNLTDVGELFQMRELLEGFAARLAAESGLPTDDIESLIDEFSAYQEPNSAHSVDDYYKLTSKLDDALIARVRNNRLKDALREVWMHTRRLRHYASGTPSRISGSAAEHLAILGAIRDHNPEAAEKALREHLINSRNAIVSKLLELR